MPGTTILGADDKVGLAAMLESIRFIQENELEHGTIQFENPFGSGYLKSDDNAQPVDISEDDLPF